MHLSSSCSWLCQIFSLVSTAKSVVRCSVSTHPQHFLWASTQLEHVWRPRAPKMGQVCRVWLVVWGPVQQGHSSDREIFIPWRWERSWRCPVLSLKIVTWAALSGWWLLSSSVQTVRRCCHSVLMFFPWKATPSMVSHVQWGREGIVPYCLQYWEREGGGVGWHRSLLSPVLRERGGGGGIVPYCLQYWEREGDGIVPYCLQYWERGGGGGGGIVPYCLQSNHPRPVRERGHRSLLSPVLRERERGGGGGIVPYCLQSNHPRPVRERGHRSLLSPVLRERERGGGGGWHRSLLSPVQSSTSSEGERASFPTVSSIERERERGGGGGSIVPCLQSNHPRPVRERGHRSLLSPVLRERERGGGWHRSLLSPVQSSTSSEGERASFPTVSSIERERGVGGGGGGWWHRSLSPVQSSTSSEGERASFPTVSSIERERGRGVASFPTVSSHPRPVRERGHRSILSPVIHVQWGREGIVPYCLQSSPTIDLTTSTLEASMPDSWLYRVSARTGRSSILNCEWATLRVWPETSFSVGSACICTIDHLIGLVVKASALRLEDQGFESCLCQDFSGSSHSNDLKTGTLPVATLPGAWRYRVSAGTGWPSVSILWLGKTESLICNFHLSVAAHTTVWADLFLRYTSMLLGH